jgi:uncharacterized protein
VVTDAWERAPGAVRRVGTVPEWPDTLDVPGLIADGWCPGPFREFVLKIHSRCDLACDYCYVYEKADQSWRSQPKRMSRAVIDQAAARIAEHVSEHDLSAVRLILHGGEPLLAGPGLIEYAIRTVRAALGPCCRVDASVQTNAVRLGPSYLDLFTELGVRVGVSLDGDAAAHDRHRRRRRGGSYALVRAALERLAVHPRRDELFGGLLCTVDVRNDPVATYQALLEFSPPMIDFLLPHGNWTRPPPGREADQAATPYADWLAAIFDHWYGEVRRPTRIRLFGEMMYALLGGASEAEAIGLSPVAVVVIETDGAIELCDSLKSTFEGAAATGLHVARDAFDIVLRHPGVAARQIGLAALPPGCRACDVVQVCGGGHYAHRYRAGNGFFNPSVFCPDLLALITHVRDTMRRDIDAVQRARPIATGASPPAAVPGGYLKSAGGRSRS